MVVKGAHWLSVKCVLLLRHLGWIHSTHSYDVLAMCQACARRGVQQRRNLCPQGVDILLGADRWCRGLVCSMAMRAVEKNQRKGVGSAGQGWNICGFKLGIRGRSPQSFLTLLFYIFTYFLSETFPCVCSVSQLHPTLCDPWTPGEPGGPQSMGIKELYTTERLNTYKGGSYWKNK